MTTRADTALEPPQYRLDARNVASIWVATSDGRLVGALYRFWRRGPAELGPSG